MGALLHTTHLFSLLYLLNLYDVTWVLGDSRPVPKRNPLRLIILLPLWPTCSLMSSVSHNPTSGMREPEADSSNGGWGSIPVGGTAGGSIPVGGTAAGFFIMGAVGVSSAAAVWYVLLLQILLLLLLLVLVLLLILEKCRRRYSFRR